MYSKIFIPKQTKWDMMRKNRCEKDPTVETPDPYPEV